MARKATVIDSSRKLSAKERIQFLQAGTSAVKLDQATAAGQVEFKPVLWAVIRVEPENDEPFDQYIIVSEDGTIYTTGSLSFWESFKLIWDEMASEDEDEEYTVIVFRSPSRKYEGKTFITCRIG